MTRLLKLAAIAVTLLAVLGWAAAADERPVVLKFDMGTADSPLKDGFLRVTPETLYSPNLGYGWEKKPAGAKDSTNHLFEYWGHGHRAVEYVLGADDLTVDCVNDPDSLHFSVNLPNGTYDVAIWVGDLAASLAHVTVSANGKPIKQDFDSRTLWRLSMDTQFGAYRLVRSRVEVTDGKLRLDVTGDKEAPAEYIEKALGGIEQTTKVLSRMAFTEVAIQGLVVHTAVFPRLTSIDGKLTSVRSDAPEEVRSFIRDFNAGDFSAATRDARSIDEKTSPLWKAEALLWLAGRPEVEEERTLLPEAIAILEPRVGESPDGLLAQDLLWDANLLLISIKTFYDYSYGYVGLGLRPQMNRIEGSLTQLDDPQRPLFWKAKLYLARSTCIMDPMRWAWWYERGQEIFREMEKQFPDNKWVRLYLDNEFNTADVLKGIFPEGRSWKGWEVPDYRADSEGAPQWAVYMREEYARLIDLVDWWIANRQIENGEIGGGWGDDVELVPYWAFCGMISDGASESVMAGTRKLVDGVWHSEEVNADEGFANIFTWVKPASELVAYSQPMMIAADYGNPRYIERAMRTTRFLRDFATGINAKGHRHFRSIYLNASRLGTDNWMKIDAPLCLRPGFGAVGLCCYNENPEAVKLMTEWLNSWYEDSLRTDKGKPRGIFPTAVAFETDELGGPGTNTWYDGRHEGLADDSFTWPAYQDYLYDLFTLWHLRTGEAKYLEPIAALVDIARHYLPDAQETLPEGTYPWFEKTVHPRFMAFARFEAAAVLNLKLLTGTNDYDAYLKAQKDLGGGLSGTKGYVRFLFDGNLQELTSTLEGSGRLLLSRWPFLTTEAGATDMMIVPGFYDLYFAMTGGDAGTVFRGLPFHAVTYEDSTKNFAALVRRQNEKEVQLWIYSFLPDDREVGIRLWRLEVGGKYQLKVGPDADEDWQMDALGTSKEFVLEHRGDSVRFVLPARKLQVVEISQTQPAGSRPKYLADLGVSDEDISWLSDNEVALRIHNIGSQAAQNVRVSLFTVDGAAREKIGDLTISNLNAPLSLDPQTKLVSFQLDPKRPQGMLELSVDPDDEVQEITERNNTLKFSARRP